MLVSSLTNPLPATSQGYKSRENELNHPIYLLTGLNRTKKPNIMLNVPKMTRNVTLQQTIWQVRHYKTCATLIDLWLSSAPLNERAKKTHHNAQTTITQHCYSVAKRVEIKLQLQVVWLRTSSFPHRLENCQPIDLLDKHSTSYLSSV